MLERDNQRRWYSFFTFSTDQIPMEQKETYTSGIGISLYDPAVLISIMSKKVLHLLN